MLLCVCVRVRFICPYTRVDGGRVKRECDTDGREFQIAGNRKKKKEKTRGQWRGSRALHLSGVPPAAAGLQLHSHLGQTHREGSGGGAGHRLPAASTRRGTPSRRGQRAHRIKGKKKTNKITKKKKIVQSLKDSCALFTAHAVPPNGGAVFFFKKKHRPHARRICGLSGDVTPSRRC